MGYGLNSVLINLLQAHVKYGINIDMSEFGLNKLPVIVVDNTFMDSIILHSEKWQEAMFTYLQHGMDNNVYMSSLSCFYGAGHLSAPVFAEVECTDTHVLYHMIGLGFYSTQSFRKFARSNFKYYRLKRLKITGMTYVRTWSLRIESQDLSWLSLMDKHITRDDLIVQLNN